MNSNNTLKELLEKAKKNGSIAESEILDLIDGDSDEYDELVMLLKRNNIEITYDDYSLENDDQDDNEEEIDEEEDLREEEDLVEEETLVTDDYSDFEEDFAHDSDFENLTTEIEQEIKTKDIDDIVNANILVGQTDDPIKLYLREIGQIDLLTTYQEVDLSRKVQDGLLAEEKIRINKKNQKIELSEEEIYELEEKIEAGDRARYVLIESNLRLVVSIAKKYLGRGMQFQDLIQEGNMGLMKAVTKFDPFKGFKFSTYATWWIRQAITRAIADQARTIRIPVHMVEQINKFVRTQRKLTQELHREPTIEELAIELETTPERVQQLLKIAQEPVSLETPVGEEDDSTLGDFVHDAEVLNPLDYTIFEKYKEEIDQVLSTLTPREEKVIRLRYGLVDNRAHTLEEVGREFGVTRERIRQIESKALKRLRHPTRQKRLIQFK